MSGIIAVYALVVAVLIAGNMKPPPDKEYSLFEGCLHLACGLSVGLTGLAAGYAIGIVGDAVRRWRGQDSWIEKEGANRVAGRTSVYATISDLRRDGAYVDFWGGAWALWTKNGLVYAR
ncbi:v-type proton ATPase 16 kDa proteolipid subunit 2 [Vermiconidia calcicola]|uniref:V-type proton ATPase 16 kDa proteolipid subunit 2 n=1 Tax=Vermiconidia calcicola TaxID=1690605 RepID=A0ACC3N9W3_9PEZI|nr:v-type proton ATPase 16 kDa proteolipid subunit 2 [Vermiconidia calcicola]